MPKRSTTARIGAQRKARAQRNVEVSAPEVLQPEQPVKKPKSSTATVTEESTHGEAPAQEATLPKSGARAKLANRRAATQKNQRVASSIVTPEHFAYVKKDLLTIGILTVVMLAVMLALYFTIGSQL
ncbi:hypothetical protein EI42_01547 [Thermosporothrix hazakensis]|jgi:hypothetical protein|uniref:Uncharacterized protein n=2 Tax=Thermosporothrix TaxID=768650 RepID=A0A326UBQ5_THEHA|nr:hypothetical protein [Thermosporothrix hazakensis]PZW32999.1 hypothetical protein EI42_01547 [Thermosporothrix hazakensis]BBH90981.1 hypothetical protein KTC_57320 [Thermosporothrix sp. COM3]GCE49031.1 hypothetical protein KTH_39000 [Thermosporothrix hazakensis]